MVQWRCGGDSASKPLRSSHSLRTASVQLGVDDDLSGPLIHGDLFLLSRVLQRLMTESALTRFYQSLDGLCRVHGHRWLDSPQGSLAWPSS